MAPTGPKASQPQRRPTPPPPVDERPKGPSPGNIALSTQYRFEQNIRRLQKEYGCDPAREDSYRIQGVQLIDSVRQALRLPVKTFTTACTYYHLFRLCHRDAEYNYQDASLAALFMACKVEDTIKKSKEILCAAYNIKNPDHPTTQDDKAFDSPHKIIIGLERHILETIGFDFRARYPQKILVKTVRRLYNSTDGRDVIPMAYDMSIDMYRTFSPIKASSFTMVLAVIELTALLNDRDVERIRSLDLDRYHTTRHSVVEVMLDLLDLYTQFSKHTTVGMKFELSKFIDIKIKLNQEVDDSEGAVRRFDVWCDKCEDDEKIRYPITPGSATSPATTGSWPGGKRPMSGQEPQTMRFVYDAEEARREREVNDEYTKEEWEEYEIEVEEKLPDPEPRPHHNGRDRGRRNHHEHWGPYPRSRQDRHKGGRKGGYY
ncbi:RNA polymerase II C-terminal domain kinase beta subunit [Gnomoniopsis smithogilvyi]|uniref:RNA polymerase II holoenzyme cyclin-like subunit n=1 Tax=Gnomoniopsis smithogilvyi TaxID=1191159 RepID=A0A9W8YJJ7_9PEZI|nr:RNA polymerase II C-terminal domain kinase beta subunit [Gnomoniopsis smithogilvyi]